MRRTYQHRSWCRGAYAFQASSLQGAQWRHRAERKGSQLGLFRARIPPTPHSHLCRMRFYSVDRMRFLFGAEVSILDFFGM